MTYALVVFTLAFLCLGIFGMLETKRLSSFFFIMAGTALGIIGFSILIFTLN